MYNSFTKIITPIHRNFNSVITKKNKVMKKSSNHFNKFQSQSSTGLVLKEKSVLIIHFIKTVLLIILILNISSFFSSCQKTDKAVLKAYELRIDGKTDEAKELLLSILETDSTNAVAQFELARTLNYMNLRGSTEADKALKIALKYDPENIVYAYYNAKNCFLKAYISMQTGDDNVKNLVSDVCNEFVEVLEMKPDYPEALMYLVEIYGMLPEEMGGDKIKAEEFTQKLEKQDKFYGAKARLVIMPEGTDMVEYWKNYNIENGEDCLSLKELGVSQLFNDDINGAKESFNKAISLDKSQNIRILDLSRFHQMKVMQNREAAEKELPEAKEYIEQYLASLPEPIPPLKAFALGMLAKLEMFSGNNADAEKLMEEAKSLDPHFSRASAIPSMALFEPPNKIDQHFKSFFSWY
jgi:tetratricopeptide (TPR) repeat protein